MNKNTLFQDYKLPQATCIYVAIQSTEKIINEKAELRRSSLLNSRKYKLDLTLRYLTSSHVHNALKSQTLLFSTSNILSLNTHKVVILQLTDVLLIPSLRYSIIVKFFTNELVESHNTSNEELPQYGMRVMETTKIILCDHIDARRDCYGLEYISAIDNIRFKLLQPSPHQNIFDLLFKEDSIFSLLSIPIWKDLKEFQNLIKLPKEKNSNSTQLHPILLISPIESGLAYLLESYCTFSEIPLLKISILDLMKCQPQVEADVEKLFLSIWRIVMAQEYCVLLIDNLQDLFPPINRNAQKSDKADEEVIPFKYEERYYHLVRNVLNKFLQNYQASMANYQQRILIIGAVSEEELLHRSFISLFPTKYDLKSDLLLSPERLFLLITHVYCQTSLKFEDFEFHPFQRRQIISEIKTNNIKKNVALFTFPIVQFLYQNHGGSLRFNSCEEALFELGFTYTDTRVNVNQDHRNLKSEETLFGVESVIQQFEELIVWPVQYRSYYQAYGLLSSKTNALSTKHVLLYGPSGCGKSSLPKLLAKKFQYNLLHVNVSTLVKSSIGGTEEEIVRTFQQAKKQSPCFLILDEFTSIFHKQDSDGNDNTGEMALLSTLIHCIDDVNNWNLFHPRLSDSQSLLFKHNIVIIGITRDPQMVPRRLLSFGRFQETIYLGLLTRADRELFVTYKIQQLVPDLSNEDYFLEKKQLDTLINLMEGFSGADVDYLFRKVQNYLQRNVAMNAFGPLQVKETVLKLLHTKLQTMRPSVSSATISTFLLWKR